MISFNLIFFGFIFLIPHQKKTPLTHHFFIEFNEISFFFSIFFFRLPQRSDQLYILGKCVASTIRPNISTIVRAVNA